MADSWASELRCQNGDKPPCPYHHLQGPQPCNYVQRGIRTRGLCNALCAQRISGSYPPSTVLCGILDSFSTLAARVGTTSKWTAGKNYGTTVNDSPTCLLPYNISIASSLAVNVQHCILDETLTTNNVPSSSCQVAEEGGAVEK